VLWSRSGRQSSRHGRQAAETPLEEWQAKLPQILEDLYGVVARLGGTISGEHGIGSKRARYLPLVMAPELIALQGRIKQAFDPAERPEPRQDLSIAEGQRSGVRGRRSDGEWRSAAAILALTQKEGESRLHLRV